MTVLLPVLVALASLVSWPAFRLSERHGPESRWLMFLAVPAIAVWLALTMLGLGAQSLANIIEVLWLLAGGVVLSYIKLWIQPRVAMGQRRLTHALLFFLILAAGLLRAFMPVLPE